MERTSAQKHSPAALLTVAAIFGCVYAGAAPFQIFVTPHLRDGLGFGEIDAAMVLACVYLTFWVARLAGGRVVPAIGVRRSVTLGVAGYMLFPAALVYLKAPAPMWIAGAMWGFCASIFRVGASSTQLNCCDERRYGLWAGVGSIALYAGTIGGLAIQVALSGGALKTPAEVFRYQATFASAIAGVALLLSFALPRVEAEFPKPSVREMLAAALARRIWVVSFFMLSAGFGYGILLNTMNRAVLDHPQGGTAAYLKTLVLFYIVAGVVGFVGGHLSDRVGRGLCLVASFALAAGALALAATSDGLWAMAVGSAILGAVFGLVPTVTTAWVGDISRPEERPLWVSAVFSWRDLGIAAAIIIRGLLGTRPDPSTKTFALFGAWFLACAVLGVFKRRSIDARAPEDPPDVA